MTLKTISVDDLIKFVKTWDGNKITLEVNGHWYKKGGSLITITTQDNIEYTAPIGQEFSIETRSMGPINNNKINYMDFKLIDLNEVPDKMLNNIKMMLKLNKWTFKNILWIKRFYDEYVCLFKWEENHALFFLYECGSFGLTDMVFSKDVENVSIYEKKFIEDAQNHKDNPKYNKLENLKFPDNPEYYALCEDCKHFRGDSDHKFLWFKSEFYYSFSTCKLTRRYQNSTKHVTDRYMIEDECRQCRRNENNCGPEGKFWESKK